MDHGEIAEDFLERVCHRIFGCDFIMRSPVLHEESGDKELTDILVNLDDTLVSIQSKSMEAELEAIDEVVLGRIKKRYSNAKSQLGTTLNAHMRNSPVSGCTPLGIRINLDWDSVIKKHGIVTLHLSDALYSDPESRFQIPYAIEQYKDIVVHTFLMNDLSVMQQELFSAGDFLRYLEVREKIWRKQGNFLVANELDLLAIYKYKYDTIEAYLNGEVDFIAIEPGMWEHYNKNHRDTIDERNKRFGKSIYVEQIIRELHKSVQYIVDTQGVDYMESASGYMSIIGKLGKLTRLERTEIGETIEQKLEKTKTCTQGYFARYFPRLGIGYIFLIINSDDREMRVGFLMALAEQLSRRLECNEILGIAFDGLQMKTSCIDAALFDGDTLRNSSPTPGIGDLFGDQEFERKTEWDS